jgi:AmmeMemoRadiSam system protein A
MPASDGHAPKLIAIAREAIMEPTSPLPDWDAAWLREPGASFVTLRMGGELRGCIGTIEAHRPLGDDVHHNARSAAYRDPRFPPVSASELPELEIEVSVLSEPQPIAVSTEREALETLRPGTDGVVLEYDGRRATFLPQVWEALPDPLDFLSELRLKANLPARFWHPGVRLARYTVEKYR